MTDNKTDGDASQMMTLRQAYTVAHLFLNDYWRLKPDDDVTDVLSQMSLLADPVDDSLDAAGWYRWITVLRRMSDGPDLAQHRDQPVMSEAQT